MTFSTLASLLVVWAAALASPGPDLVQIIRVGSRSRAAGIWCALGIMLGNTLWVTASLLGMSALVTTYPQILAALQLAGGAYLLWMGFGAVCSGLAARRPGTRAPSAVPPAPDLSPARALRLGVTTNLANPKALLFFGAVFAQFVRPDMGVGWAVAVGVLLVATGVAWFTGFALAVRAMAARIARNSVLIDIVTGLVFIALGVFMVISAAG